MRNLKKKFKNLLFAVTVGQGVNSPTPLPDQVGNSGKFLTTNGSQLSWDTVSGGAGTVSSVALDMPALFNVSGSPITGSGTFAVTFNTQAANKVLAGPTTGADAVPSFRVLVAADLPNTAVTPGSYTNSSITVDAQGRLTSAANGAAGVAGSNTQIQYNDSGVLAGDADYVWDKTNNLATFLNTALGTTQKSSILLSNTTAAAAGAQQISPSIEWAGRGWKTTSTAASQAVNWRADVLPVQGTTAPTSLWRLRTGVNGGSYSDVLSLGTQSLTLNDPAASSLTTSYKFGGTEAVRQTTNSSGILVTAAKGYMSFRIGNNLDSPYAISEISSQGLYTSGYTMATGKMVAGASAANSPTTMSIYGSLGLRSTVITSDTTISTLDQAIYLCDGTNAITCSGTPSTACSSTSYAGCPARSAVGCSTITDGNCSTYDSTSSGTCTGANAACGWQTASCNAYDNNPGSCSSAGFGSNPCVFNRPTCDSYFSQFSPGSCPTGDGCSANYGAACSGLADQATCSAYSGIGCSEVTGNCDVFDNTDQSTCQNNSGCLWNATTCSGSYYTGCTGSYYDSCAGTYTGSTGTCDGTYNTGTCTGGNYGHCEGTALCVNHTTSTPCGAEAGCTWLTELTIKLPSIASASVLYQNLGPLLRFKKINSSGGNCKIQRADGAVDTIEGSTSTTLSSQYDKVTVHPYKTTSTCNDFVDEGTCTPDGCDWDGDSCEGTYTNTATWFKW